MRGAPDVEKLLFVVPLRRFFSFQFMDEKLIPLCFAQSGEVFFAVSSILLSLERKEHFVPFCLREEGAREERMR
jgi:hypothetical protein